MSEELFDPFNNENIDDNLMTNFLGDLGRSIEDSMPQLNSMRVNVSDNGKAYKVLAELPGFKKNNIDLDYRNNMLRINAKHDINKTAKNKHGKVIRHEISNNNVNRVFRLPDVNFNKISASYDGGILKVTLPKKHASKKDTHRIEIK